MSAGPSLYRRHRPRSFADVVGQEHVVRTLRNAIEQGKVHHAYLFVGSRGTGKTSMAKILAACLNCVQGPTIEPCGVCEACVAIQNATSLDVIEMDAASNNSVDDIRELRESVAFAPVSGRSKVYILDEAHMLSSQAWNAFLKTLEEPPPNTIFVLATTEAGKVLPTVVDRCHRFDFARPTVEQLSRVLRRVAEQESIEIAPDALGAARAPRDRLVPRRARHARAARHLHRAREIAAADVLAVLGVADEDVLFGALDAVAAHDAAAALDAAARFAESGRDLAVAARDLEIHARELLVVRTLGRVPDELRVTPERDARLEEQARRVAGGRPRAPARPARRGAARDQGRRRRADASRARARQDGDARGRRLDEGAAGADRAARGRDGRRGTRGAGRGDARAGRGARAGGRSRARAAAPPRPTSRPRTRDPPRRRRPSRRPRRPRRRRRRGSVHRRGRARRIRDRRLTGRRARRAGQRRRAAGARDRGELSIASSSRSGRP